VFLRKSRFFHCLIIILFEFVTSFITNSVKITKFFKITAKKSWTFHGRIFSFFVGLLTHELSFYQKIVFTSGLFVMKLHKYVILGSVRLFFRVCDPTSNGFALESNISTKKGSFGL
jgi:hypothetical protein